MDAKTLKVPITLADVAKSAGVAKSTASHVFAGSTKVAPATAERVRAAAEELGYAGPSALGRALARGRSHVVALMTRALLEDPDTDPFSLQVIDGVAREFARLGYGTVLLPPITDDASRALADSVVFDAVVTVRRMEGFDLTDKYLRARGVPWVSLDGDNNEHEAVQMDDAAAIVDVLTHLRELGHERIAAVTLLFTPQGRTNEFVDMEWITKVSAPNIRRRLVGFAKAKVEPVAVFKCGFVGYGNGVEAGRALLDMADPPTAIVCMADLHAAGVIDVAHQRGLHVPQDLSVTGFDGLPMERLVPHKLTTVVQSGVNKGRAVARHVAELMEGKNPAPQTLELTLRVGSTTGQAPPRDDARV